MADSRKDDEILRIGGMMSNVMFNLKQRSVTTLFDKREKEQFAELQEQWDEAVRKYRDSFKRKKVSHGR